MGNMGAPRGAVAQLGERLNGIQEVASSILVSSTILVSPYKLILSITYRRIPSSRLVNHLRSFSSVFNPNFGTNLDTLFTMIILVSLSH